jgi:amino acid permease
MNKEIKTEARLTFFEATSIIVGHGVGSGILSVPFLASRNDWKDMIWIVVVAYLINLVMHFMIAELSYNNGGAQFIKCFENELFVGKLKTFATWLAFGLLG